LEERILGMNNTTMFSSKFKLSYLLYSCAIELEYSFHVIILTYELTYSLCVMILTCSYDIVGVLTPIPLWLDLGCSAPHARKESKLRDQARSWSVRIEILIWPAMAIVTEHD
jgi:hypothetical protein